MTIYTLGIMTSYNKEAYLKLKQENPEKILENGKKSYAKLKETDPERLKEYRHNAYLRYKEKNAEKLKASRNEASKKYYENNREKIIKNMLDKYHTSKSISGTFNVSTDVNKEQSNNITMVLIDK